MSIRTPPKCKCREHKKQRSMTGAGKSGGARPIVTDVAIIIQFARNLKDAFLANK